jgi:hypothetical protein
MNCSKCGKEILDEKSSFCAYCGIPLDSEHGNTDFVTGAGIMAIVAAASSITICAIGIAFYQSYSAYYATYGLDASGSVGFLLFAGFALVSSIFGFAGGVLSLAKKRFSLAVLGTILMLASAIFTFTAVWRYGYGFGEGILLAGIPTLALSVMSTVFLVKSKTAFSDYAARAETSEVATSLA